MSRVKVDPDQSKPYMNCSCCYCTTSTSAPIGGKSYQHHLDVKIAEPSPEPAYRRPLVPRTERLRDIPQAISKYISFLIKDNERFGVNQNEGSRATSDEILSENYISDILKRPKISVPTLQFADFLRRNHCKLEFIDNGEIVTNKDFVNNNPRKLVELTDQRQKQLESFKLLVDAATANQKCEETIEEVVGLSTSLLV